MCSLVAKVLEEIAQDFEGLDPDTLTLRCQEFADHPATWETHSHTDFMSVNESYSVR